MTHDSIGLGEDGPTHQPVEHIASLRAIPNLIVIRPSDILETIESWEYALKSRSPTILVLTRQNLPILSKQDDLNIIKIGGYAIIDFDNYRATILATGSEVGLAMEVVQLMKDKNIRVVSMPCWEIFEKQSDDYKNLLIPKRGSMKISIEAGITMGWDKYIGSNGLSIGLDHYGASAPGKDLAEEFGFTATKVEAKIRKHLNNLL
jgi:transketolase